MFVVGVVVVVAVANAAGAGVIDEFIPADCSALLLPVVGTPDGLVGDVTIDSDGIETPVGVSLVIVFVTAVGGGADVCAGGCMT